MIINIFVKHNFPTLTNIEYIRFKSFLKKQAQFNFTYFYVLFYLRVFCTEAPITFLKQLYIFHNLKLNNFECAMNMLICKT